MISLALLFYLGSCVNAPVWYWVCWGIKAFVDVVCMSYRLCKEEKK